MPIYYVNSMVIVFICLSQHENIKSPIIQQCPVMILE
uniref:Uncharacterized protein n=1 Tax=Arundo donax TaxID=35708 RepID=A0A0A9C5A1_ARUDO